MDQGSKTISMSYKQYLRLLRTFQGCDEIAPWLGISRLWLSAAAFDEREVRVPFDVFERGEPGQ